MVVIHGQVGDQVLVALRVPRKLPGALTPAQRRARAKQAKAHNRAAVYKRDRHRCRYCGSGERLTVDHVIPRSRGGRNRRSNFQTLCADCNEAKDDALSPLADFILNSVRAAAGLVLAA